MSVDFFYPNVCHVCKTFFNYKHGLKKCSQCKLVAYCSVEHQKQNWQDHQPLCRVVRKILKHTKESTIFDIVPKQKDWQSVRSLAMCLTEAMMGRQLHPQERQMFWFPLACKVCHSLEPKNLLDCGECHCVLYCSTNHKSYDKSFHERICKELKLCFELDNLLVDPSFYPSIKTPIMSEYRDLPTNIEEFITNFVEMPADNNQFLYIASEVMTCITTLMYAMEQATFKVLVLHGRLTIHVVGAEALESTMISTLEVLLHWLDEITTLTIVFVGPECVPLNDPNPQLCPICYLRKKINIVFIRSLYHDYAQSFTYTKPDIILAFNCGFHEMEESDNDLWKATIPYFLKNVQVLTVITAYTKDEADKDFKRLLSSKPTDVNSHVLTKCIRNPFRSLRPHRDWENETVFYQNNYITIMKTVDEVDWRWLIDLNILF